MSLKAAGAGARGREGGEADCFWFKIINSKGFKFLFLNLSPSPVCVCVCVWFIYLSFAKKMHWS